MGVINMLDLFKNRLFIVFAMLFVMGVFFTISGSIENSGVENAELDFNYMDEYKFKDGLYVKGRVYEIYGEFAVEETQQKRFGITTSSRISSHYYVVPMIGTFESDSPVYIAVEISHVGMVEEAEKLMEQTWDYYDNGIEPAIWNEFDIKGKVSPLEGELLDYMYEWFMYGDPGATRADYEQYICPYIVTYRNTSSSYIVFTVILAAVGAVGLTVIIMLHLRENSVPKNTYNQFSYSNQGSVVPPYSPDAAKDMTDRGFPPPEPVNSDIPVQTNTIYNDDRFGTNPEEPDSAVSSMPSVEKSISSDNNDEESKKKDWWSI